MSNGSGSGVYWDSNRAIKERDALHAEIERLRAELRVLSDNFTHAWAGETRADTIRIVERRARKALGG